MSRGARHDLLAQAGVGAAVAVEFGLHRGEGTVTLGAGFDTDDGGVALGMEAQALLAGVEHLHRPARHLCGQRGVELAGDVLLAAKAATHDGALDAHSLFGQAETARHLAAVGVGNLAAHVDGQLVVGAIARVGPARRHADRALRLQEGVLGHGRAVGALHDDVGGGKAGFEVAVAHLDMLEQVAVGPVGV